MNLKKNVYLVLTEYQLLQAINISMSVYNDSTQVNIIYIVRNGKRLMTINADKIWSLDNIKIIILDNETDHKIVEKIRNEIPNHFLFFQGGSAVNVFLAYTFSKKDVEISLGPDGYGPYAVFNKKNYLLSVIRDSYKQNFYLLSKKLFSGKIHRFDYYRYGNHSFIDNLWITHPDQYLHRAKNKVNIIKLPNFNLKCINFIKEMFNFEGDFPMENVIYFFNQPFKKGVIEQEYVFLKEVIETFPEKQIIIKLHPLSDPKIKILYKKLKQVQLIDTNLPAEVLLLSLKNCIVFTGWSAVLITENKTCNYYFNYPFYKDLNNPIINQIQILQLNHIAMIHSPTEMKFPNE